MEGSTFTEDELKSKKYGELLKIGRTFGIRTRIKTAKLIEAILEGQSNSCLSEASTVIDALNESCAIEKKEESKCMQEDKPTESEVVDQTEELLTDIQFPENLDAQETAHIGNLPEAECSGTETSNKETKNKRRRTRTFDLEDGGSSKDNKEETSNKETRNKRRRAGTFDLDEEMSSKDNKDDRQCGAGTSEEGSTILEVGNNSKRRRTSTFEIGNGTANASMNNDEGDSSVDVGNQSKRRRTSTFEIDNATPSATVNNVKLQENSDQLQSMRKSISESQKELQSVNSDASVCSNSGLEVKQRAVRSRSFVIEEKEVEKVSQTPEVGRNNKPRTVKTPAAREAKTPKIQRSCDRKSRFSLRLSTGRSETKSKTPGSVRKDTASKIVKPLFNVGRGGPVTKDEKQGSKPSGSGIPRFVTFARKMKVPNFSKIHEKAFKRMEALDDYVEKKKKMADVLNSGTKKPRTQPAAEDIFKPEVTSVKNLNLNFMGNAAEKTPVSKARKSPAAKSVSKSRNSLTASSTKPPVSKSSNSLTASSTKPLVSKSRNSLTASSTKPPVSKVAMSKDVTIKSSQSSVKNFAQGKSAKKSPKLGVKSSSLKLKSPKVFAKKSPTGGTLKKNLPNKSPAAKNSPRARYSTLPTPVKENIKPGRASIASPAPSKLKSDLRLSTPGSIHKRWEYDPKATQLKPLKYVPYKGTLKPLNSTDVHKSMAAKLPAVKTVKERRENNRSLLKGVRFNKRFELQMAKRGIDLSQ